MYDKRSILYVTLPSFDFGAGIDETMSFRLPTGYNAKLVKIGVMLTETVAADTTAPTVKLGTAADDDAYANLVINRSC
jgi:hypothetical protein